MSKFPAVCWEPMAYSYVPGLDMATSIRNAARVYPTTGTFACRPPVGLLWNGWMTSTRMGYGGYVQRAFEPFQLNR